MSQTELLTIPEVARELRISRAGLYRRILRPGVLKTVRIGAAVRVRRQDLAAYLDEAASAKPAA
jgi:excisionase family DNA binding protein